jgi:hypothetical protein
MPDQWVILMIEIFSVRFYVFIVVMKYCCTDCCSLKTSDDSGEDDSAVNKEMQKLDKETQNVSKTPI